MTIGEFWKQQEFAYLVTYSFNREPKLEEAVQEAKRQLETARFMRQPEFQRKLRYLEERLGKLTEGLIDWNPTATPIANIGNHSIASYQLADICFQAGRQEAFSGCRPIYRDALAFYNEQDELVRVLNICFQCHYLITDTGLHVEADLATYQALYSFLKSCGHPIELQEK